EVGRLRRHHRHRRNRGDLVQSAMTALVAIGHALWLAFAMFWVILWPLVLGFALSGAIQAVVSKQQMARVLGEGRPKTLLKARRLGAASSSCSYAAVAIARSIFRRGADFTAAMAFELASTNLVLELTIIIVVFLGWQFAAAEFVGAPLMIAALALLFRRFLSRRAIDAARAQADRGLAGKMEGHAGMHMEVTEGTLLRRLTSDRGFTAISHYFMMDWISVWKDVAGGLLIAGALAAWGADGMVAEGVSHVAYDLGDVLGSSRRTAHRDTLVR